METAGSTTPSETNPSPAGTPTAWVPTGLEDMRVIESEHSPEPPAVAEPQSIQEWLLVGRRTKNRAWWDKTVQALVEGHGEELSEGQKLPRIMLSMETSHYDILALAMEKCVAISENDALPAEMHTRALDTMARLGDVRVKVAKQMTEFGEKAKKIKGSDKKRNLPPQTTVVQVNVDRRQTEPRPATELPAPRIESGEPSESSTSSS